ncbi:MAG: hypothetical protein M1837_000480 [Sclerophora amabilis]|nr:MAG: hypothetical protein M1837_000480 [Sclerophora amabilis]
MTYVQHEIQVRIWWSVYSLERLLGVMTGRPSAIHDEDVSTLLPDATDEDSFPADNGDLNDGCFDSVAHGNREPSRHAPTPNNHFRRTSQNQSKSPSNKISSRGTSLLSSMSSSSPLATPRDSETSDSALVTPNKATYFVFRIRMNKIMHHILTSLYSASTVQHSWADVQQFIRGNEAQFARWRSDLPTAFNFSDPHQDQSFARERLGLGLLYWSCNILVYRPCLCRLEGKITEESSKSKDFNQKAARDCVNAARNLLALLPDENDMVAFLYLCPWWSILHYLMQAVVVLIIELKMQVCHLPNGLEVVLKDTQKALRLLRFMAKGDVAASRACRLIDKLLRLVEPQIGHNLSKLTPHGRSRSTRPNVPLPPSDTHHSRSYLPFEGLQDQNGFLSHFNLNSVDGRSSPDRDHFYSTFMHSIFDQDVQFPAGTSSMFPTESQMNFLNEDETDSHMADGMGH